MGNYNSYIEVKAVYIISIHGKNVQWETRKNITIL